MVSVSQIKNLLTEYMKTNLNSFLGSDNYEISCFDRYGFLVCATSFKDDTNVEFDVTRDFISNGVSELPSDIEDIPVSNIFVREGDKIKYFVVLYYGDIQYKNGG